jgi:phosphate transport system substrate-binding protein
MCGGVQSTEIKMRLLVNIKTAFCTLLIGSGMAMGQTRLQGAGSTFINPMMQRWVSEYQKLHPDIQIDYQSIGSGGGVKGFTDKTIDFAASDAPLSKKDIQNAGGSEDIVEFPIISGGVVPAYNVPGLTAKIKFSGSLLVDIYTGKITRWNDPAIAKLNDGAALPDLAITPVWRTDGSGTTFIWSSYLSTQSEDFKSNIGAAKQVKWPAGVGGKGNEGVAAAVQQTPGTIGYIEQAYADHNNIAYGQVQNKNGKFVTCTPASVSKAGGGAADKFKGNLLVANFWNQPGDDAYPISGVTYIIVYKDLKNIKNQQQAQSLINFLSWTAHDGQKMATEMDYAPLSDTLIGKIDAVLGTVTYNGKSVKP